MHAHGGEVPQGTLSVGGEIFDDVALEVSLRRPPNAKAFAFHTALLTHEYPEGVCSFFRDQFLALLTPTPAAWSNANMVFDQQGIPLSAEFQPLSHCDPATLSYWAYTCENLATTGCPEAPDPWSASTGWLQTKVPLDGHEPFEIRFLIFDIEDSSHDSTVLIDGFTWLGEPGIGETPVTFTR